MQIASGVFHLNAYCMIGVFTCFVMFQLCAGYSRDAILKLRQHYHSIMFLQTLAMLFSTNAKKFLVIRKCDISFPTFASAKLCFKVSNWSSKKTLCPTTN